VNVLFAAATIILVHNLPTTATGGIGFVEGFALFLCGIVLFRLFFSLLYVIIWRIRILCFKKYQNPTVSYMAEFEKVKKNKDLWESSDEEESNDTGNSKVLH